MAAVAASLEFDFEYGSVTAHEFARDDFKDITRAFYSASKDPREAAKEIDAKYMGGNESCKKAEGHDGWDDWEDIEGLEESIEGIENLAYELRNCVRGAKTRCKDWKSLSLYIKSLASNLDDAAELMVYKDEDEDESKKHEDSDQDNVIQKFSITAEVTIPGEDGGYETETCRYVPIAPDEESAKVKFREWFDNRSGYPEGSTYKILKIDPVRMYPRNAEALSPKMQQRRKLKAWQDASMQMKGFAEAGHSFLDMIDGETFNSIFLPVYPKPTKEEGEKVAEKIFGDFEGYLEYGTDYDEGDEDGAWLPYYGLTKEFLNLPEGEGLEVLSELSDVLYKAYTKGA